MALLVPAAAATTSSAEARRLSSKWDARSACASDHHWSHRVRCDLSFSMRPDEVGPRGHHHPCEPPLPPGSPEASSIGPPWHSSSLLSSSLQSPNDRRAWKTQHSACVVRGCKAHTCARISGNRRGQAQTRERPRKQSSARTLGFFLVHVLVVHRLRRPLDALLPSLGGVQQQVHCKFQRTPLGGGGTAASGTPSNTDSCGRRDRSSSGCGCADLSQGGRLPAG